MAATNIELLTDPGCVASDAAHGPAPIEIFCRRRRSRQHDAGGRATPRRPDRPRDADPQLEEDLGVALLLRHSRGVEPTKAGTLLLSRAIAILKSVEEARQEVSACDREEIEAIRLGTTPALMPVIGSEIALIVREQLPQVSLSIVEAMSHVLVDTLARGRSISSFAMTFRISRNCPAWRCCRTIWFL